MFRKELQKINLSFAKIEEIGINLREYGLNILEPTKGDRDYLNILHYTYSKKDSIKFISKLNNNDIKTLQEKINMSDTTLITYNDIQDMIKCWEFIQNLGEIKGKKNDKELIKDFIKKVSETNNISQNFYNYVNIANKLKEIFAKL